MEERKGYIPVEIFHIKPEGMVGCNLYFYFKGGNQYVLYKKAGLRITSRELERLTASRVHYLYIEGKDEGKYLDYLEANLNYYLENKELEPEKKSSILYHCAAHRVEEILNDPRSGENIKRSKELVEHSINYILLEPDALQNLSKIMSHDYYTYTHSVNVCFFCVALVHSLGCDDQSALYEVGLGALLHDVGKSSIDPKIINKKGALTEEEMEMIKLHPLNGLDLIKKSNHELPEAGKSIISQHHEKMNGTGYPLGLKGDEIHRYARIACIVDIFDALTTRRPYKTALNSFNALKLMKDLMSEELDGDLFRDFVYMLKG